MTTVEDENNTLSRVRETINFESLPRMLEQQALAMGSGLTIDCSDDDDDDTLGGGPMRSARDRKRCLSPRSREDLRLKINLRERQRMHDLNVSR